MTLIPDNFPAVAQFAACERYLRGAGSKGQYDYTIHDCLVVAWAYTNNGTHRVSDATIKALTKSKSAINLNQAWATHLEEIAK